MDFVYTTPPIMVTWQTPKADKVSKIILKVVQEDFDNICKKWYRLHLMFFSFTKFSTIRGLGRGPGNTPPPIPPLPDGINRGYQIHKNQRYSIYLIYSVISSHEKNFHKRSTGPMGSQKMGLKVAYYNHCKTCKYICITFARFWKIIIIIW